MSGTGGWQTQAYDAPAAAIAGDRASNNTILSYDAGPGGLIAGAAGVTIGRFAWTTAPLDPNGTNQIVNSFGGGPVAGFVMRGQQGLQPNYLALAGMTIQAGYEMALQIGGDFWVVNDGTAEATRGMKAYADYATGKVSFAATGAPTQGASTTGSIAASTFSVTATIANDVMTVSAVGSGTVVPGAAISGTGVVSGSKVIGQITPLLAGEALGGIGRYFVTIGDQTVTSTTVSGTYGTMTITAVGSGSLVIGDVLAGANVTAGSRITAFGTGTGGIGTYIVDPTQTAASATITASSNVETKWIARSEGLPGEIVKISSWAEG